MTTFLEWDLADRLRKSLRHTDISGGEMAEYLGVSGATVSTWLTGRATPRAAFLRLWAMRCGVPYEWLLLDPGAEQAAALAELTRQHVELRSDHDIYADASAPRDSKAAGRVVPLSRRDSNLQPSD